MISSQAALHARFGGVVPEVASRHHLELVNPVVDAALAEAEVELGDIESLAVTRGPGLIGALLVGCRHREVAGGGYAKAPRGRRPPARARRRQLPRARPARAAVPVPDRERWPHSAGGRAGAGDVRGARADRSTTRPERRSTRAPGCSASATRVARRSSGRPPMAIRAAFAFPGRHGPRPGPRLQLQRPEDRAPLRDPRARPTARSQRRRADLAASYQAAVVGQLTAKLERALAGGEWERRGARRRRRRELARCARGPPPSARSAGCASSSSPASCAPTTRR